MATLTVQPLNYAGGGIEPTFAAVAATGDEMPNDGKTYAEFVNSHVGNAYTITFVTPATLKGLAVTDPPITLAAGVGKRRKAGPFPTSLFNNANGRVAITYSGAQPATDVTVGVFQLP